LVGLVGFVCLVGLVASAQKDTTKKQSIDITSSFKPVLRNSVKVNFSAAHINADTTRLPLNYKVPAQYLYYTYHPTSLKPLALAIDTSTQLGLRNFIKAGYGNYATPYVKAGFSFGDGKKALLNVYADYISSKGKITFQDYQQFGVKAQGSYFTERNEIYGGLGVNQNDNYFYGYNHSLYQFNKADVLQTDFSETRFLSGGLIYFPKYANKFESAQIVNTRDGYFIIAIKPGGKRQIVHLEIDNANRALTHLKQFATKSLIPGIVEIDMLHSLK
jgi:hypothetical protein